MKIDTEFESITAKFSDEQLGQLKEDILSNGIQEPLVVWAGYDILLDGHKRYAIADLYGLDFETTEVELPGRYCAKLWIVNRELERDDLATSREMYLKGLQLVFGNKAKLEWARAKVDRKTIKLQGVDNVVVDSEFKALIPSPNEKELE